MNQPTLFELQIKPPCECDQCGGPIKTTLDLDGICEYCRIERQRMDEFDKLIDSDAHISAVWGAFGGTCYRKIDEGAKHLMAMPILYDARAKVGLQVSNSLAPMLARKFNQVSGHDYFKVHRLKVKP